MYSNVRMLVTFVILTNLREENIHCNNHRLKKYLLNHIRRYNKYIFILQ